MTEISCPTCGAKSNSIVANCEYCGVEIANAQNLKPEEYISAMGRAMVKARENAGWFSGNKDEAEIAALKAFPIPTEIQTLTAFFMFCHGNVQGGVEGISDKGFAWRSKTKGAYDMLRLASLNNPQITAFLDDFKSSYSEDGMRAAGRKLTRFYVAYFAGALVFFVVIAFVVTHF